jgi:Holliday junction resolvase RusA-like endonuclease
LEPRPQKRPRSRSAGGKAYTYKDPGQEADESNLVAALLPHRPGKPMEGALSLTWTAAFPMPKSMPKRARAEARFIRKPDIDNLEKFLMDCLQTAQFYLDDKQVVRTSGEKVYREGPGYWLMVLAPA